MLVLVALVAVGVVLFALMISHQNRARSETAAAFIAYVKTHGEAAKREPRQPNIAFASRGFRDVMIARRNRLDIDLNKYVNGNANLMLQDGAAVEEALSAQWGGLVALHADLALFQDALDAYADTKRAIGIDPDEGERNPGAHKFMVASSMLIGTQLALHPDDFERFLRHVGR